MDPRERQMLAALQSADFFNRYSDICEKFRVQDNQLMKKPESDQILDIVRTLGFDGKYFRVEKFYKLWPSGSAYADPENLLFRMMVDVGHLELLIAVKIDGELVGGPLFSFPYMIGSEDSTCPGFRNYEEFREVFSALIPLYEDMRKAFAPIIDKE